MASRQSDVVAWCPVPKALLGSMKIFSRASNPGSALRQGGRTTNRLPQATGVKNSFHADTQSSCSTLSTFTAAPGSLSVMARRTSSMSSAFSQCTRKRVLPSGRTFSSQPKEIMRVRMPDTISYVSSVSVSMVSRISFLAMAICSSLGLGAGLSGKRRLQAAPPASPLCQKAAAYARALRRLFFSATLYAIQGRPRSITCRKKKLSTSCSNASGPASG